MRLFLLLLLTLPLCAADPKSEPGFRFVYNPLLVPGMKSIVAVDAGMPGPGQASHKAIGSISNREETLKVPENNVGYALWFVPKSGLAVKAVSAAKTGNTLKEIKLDHVLGTIVVRGDNFARLGKITVTDQRDPGPDEKGHVPVQVASEYKTEMVVPEGFYAVWITPHNGAKSQKVADRIRVVAGRDTIVE